MYFKYLLQGLGGINEFVSQRGSIFESRICLEERVPGLYPIPLFYMDMSIHDPSKSDLETKNERAEETGIKSKIRTFKKG